MATQPTTPPSVTTWPDAPSRAEPSTFSDKADAFLGHFPVGQADQSALVTWLNSTAGQAYQNALESAASATASAASADLAQDALDSAISTTNYKGAWSSLTGALNIPASVSHNNGVWLLTTNLANVAASEPAIGNADWLLIYSRATDVQVETGVAYTNPDSKQLKDFAQRDWGELTTAKTYNDSCFYRGKEYDINIPVDDVTLAPPTTAGRTFTNFDGSTQYITIPTINLIAGDVVKFKFLAPTGAVAGYLFDSDLANDTNRAYCILGLDGRYIVTYSPFYVDGIEVSDGGLYPTDGLIHSVEIPVTLNRALGTVGNRFSFDVPYKGRIYDLEVYRGGERIHYYPLRTDAIDYLAGNLIKDEEFTSKDNWNPTTLVSVVNNAANFINGDTSTFVIQSSPNITESGTYRFIYDYAISTGGIKLATPNLADFDTYQTGTGTRDFVGVVSSVVDGRVGFLSQSNTNGTIKSARVIKLNELSPSASFSSATGFTLSGGVTITGGQAVFGAVAGTKSVSFPISLVAGKKYRAAFKTNSRTVGGIRVQANSTSDTDLPQAFIIDAGGTYYYEFAALQTNTNAFYLLTTDGWDGNVEYFSVTEVTDGTEVGSPLKTFERNWKLKSGEQLLPQNAGIVRFGVPATIDASNTLEIEPLANASKGDYIKVTRANDAEPIVKLSAADIAAGRLIKFGAQTDTELTIDSDKAVILEHNGTDLEVKL